MNKLVNPKLLLDLPAIPGGRHNGGVVLVGKIIMLYLVVGDVAKVTKGSRTQAQNFIVWTRTRRKRWYTTNFSGRTFGRRWYSRKQIPTEYDTMHMVYEIVLVWILIQ